MEISVLLATYGSLFLAGANVTIFCIIKFNDLFHLEKKLNEVSKVIDNIDKKLDNTAERIAKVEGKCIANHG